MANDDDGIAAIGVPRGVHISDVRLRFADDNDMLQLEPELDDGNGNGLYPRRTKGGARIRSWDPFHQESMNELERRFRSKKNTAEPFRLGQMDPRTQDRMRPVVARFALHFLFVAADKSNEDRLARKAGYYWERAISMLEAEITLIDYDTDNSGDISSTEENQPFPSRLIRG